MENKLEKMKDFFATRVEFYDEHMLQDVEGCKEGYLKLAELLPQDTASILDLGCGTGLELDEIFRRIPGVFVVGVDLTPAMLVKLQQKYPNKNIQLICGDYFKVNFGENQFDTAISFQTMHHFSHEQKQRLYSRIKNSLKPNGRYFECDYMVTDQATEDRLYSENAKIRRELHIPESEFYHFDTPCTIDNQVLLLKKAGFCAAEFIWRMGNTTIIEAAK